VAKSSWAAVKDNFTITRYLDYKSIQYSKKGRNISLRCPFPWHPDSTPSFVVYEESRYYCFGCSSDITHRDAAQGDVFDLVAHIEGKSKIESLTFLAGLAGVELNDDSVKLLQSRFEDSEVRRSEANRYSVELSNNPNWLHHLKTKRGLTLDTVTFFGLGVTNQSLTIPLKDSHGRLLGFTTHHPKSSPKYTNPTTTDVFKKDRFLFNADSVRGALSDDNTLYIAEGYFDVMALWQAGYRGAVGLCGAKLTRSHATLIKELIKEDTRVIFVPDADAVGWQSLEGNFNTLRQECKNSCYAATLPSQLPDGTKIKDVGEYLGEFKYKVLPDPKPVLHVIVDYVISQSPSDVQIQAHRVKRVLTYANEIEKGKLVKQLAASWDVDEKFVSTFLEAKYTQSDEVAWKDSEYRINELIQYIKDIDKLRLSMGLPEVDEVICGINPGEVLGLMGRANTGKTLLLTDLLDKMMSAGKRVPAVVFSLEMQAVQLQTRMLMQFLRISDQKALEARIKEGDPLVLSKMEDLKKAHSTIVVVDVPGLSVADMERRLDELEASFFHEKVQLVLVDHLHIIKGEGKNNYERTGACIKDFRDMIRRRNCVGIMLIQTSRKGGTGGEPITMADCRDSGEVEETLDFLLGIWRPELKAQAEMEQVRAAPIQPVPKLKKGDDGSVLKDSSGARQWESSHEALDRARKDRDRQLYLASKAADEQRGVVILQILKSRREGRNEVFIYQLDGLTFKFVQRGQAEVPQAATDDVEDPLAGNNLVVPAVS
jgi:replicative DNA helicase